MKTILGNPKLKNQKLNYTFEPTVYHFIKNMQIVWLHCSKKRKPKHVGQLGYHILNPLQRMPFGNICLS